MKHARRTDNTLILRAQVLVVVALPWVVCRAIAPGAFAWAVTCIGLTIAFAIMRRSDPRVWLLPVNAVTSAALEVPSFVAAATSVAVGVYLLIDPPRENVTWTSPVRWVVVGILVALAAGIGARVVVVENSGNATFVAAQEQAAEVWDAPLIGAPSTQGDTQATTPAESSDPEGQADPAQTVTEETAPGGTAQSSAQPAPFAKMSFRRPGSSTAPVTASTLFIGDSVNEYALTRGPGHYPQTAKPGKQGNFAVAGHRTGWGAPFGDLDKLQPGDVVTVQDRKGRTFDYEVVGSEIVDPSDVWVISDDPLGTGQPTLTLTTCDPPGINTKRLIVWAELITSA